MDKILIKDLLVRCIIGVNDDERREKQDVVINIVLWADLAEAARTDDFKNAVDYRSIKKAVLKETENSSCQLVEALASRIADICLAAAGVRKVQVSVEKPSALRFARSVGVEITREKGA